MSITTELLIAAVAAPLGPLWAITLAHLFQR